jgi:hypothetical protein
LVGKLVVYAKTFHTGELMILAALRKLYQDFQNKQHQEDIKQYQELSFGAKMLRRLQDGGGDVSGLQLWIRPKWELRKEYVMCQMPSSDV